MFWWLVQNTLLAGVLALAAALAGRFSRLSPAVRHALWLVVLVKLITPPVTFYSLPESEPWADWLVAWPLGKAPPQAALQGDLQPPEADKAIVERPAIELAEDVNEESVVEIWELPGSAPEEALAIELEETADVATPILYDAAEPDDLDRSPRKHASSSPSGPTATRTGTYAVLRSALVGIWAFGAAWMGVLQAVRLVRLRRLLRGAETAPSSLTALVDEIATQLGVSAPRVLLTSATCSPMIFAWGRPRLIWPKSLSDSFDSDARRAVVAHELAHLRRRDHWVGWLELAAGCGWWWNPLFWYVRRQLRETAELACDAWVVELLPGGRRAYAQALIEVSELISWTAAPAPAVGMGASARHLFERRLTMILRERVPCRAPLVGLASIGLLGIAVLPGWTKGQAPADEAPAAAPNSPAAALPPVAESPAPQNDFATPPGENDKSPVDEPPASTSRSESPAEKPAPPAPPAPPAMEYPLRQLGIDFTPRQLKQLQQIQAIERQIAKLSAEIAELRDKEQETFVLQNTNLGPRVVVAGEPKAAHSPNGSKVRANLSASPGREIQMVVPAGRPATVRFTGPTTIGRVSLSNPDVAKISEHSDSHLVLIGVHPGEATATITDNKQQVATLRVFVVAAEDGTRKPPAANAAVVAAPEAGRSAEKKPTFYFKQGFVDRGPAKSVPGADVETLTRAKYKLPPGRAAAFSAFIKEHVKEDVETKVDGDMLVVTAPSEDQAGIAQFVQLLKTTEVIMEETAPIAPQGKVTPGNDRFSASAVPPPVDLSVPDSQPGFSPQGALPR